MNAKKLMVVDTSVLLYDKESIHSFPGNEVVLPLTVLDELDSFKERPGLLGESARYVNRFLDSLRAHGRLDHGVEVPGKDQSIRVLTHDPAKHDGLDDRSDNKIIAAALELQRNRTEPVLVITKDINLRVKCDALGLEAEDYYRDHVKSVPEEQGSIKSIQVIDEEIDQVYEEGSIEIDDTGWLSVNSYVVLNGDGQGKSALCYYDGKRFHRLQEGRIKSHSDIQPRNKEQRFVMHALRKTEIPLVCLTGLAGSGKTFLALMSGIDEMLSGKYERIIVTRNIEPVGRDIGFLPGDIKEKMSPWLSPLMDNFRHHFKDKTYFEMMMDKGQIEIAPLSYIRGRTFSNAYLIVDEAQNATIHELKTVITRIGENSKIVLMGDTDQIDTPYIDKRSNGLSIVIDKFAGSSMMAHVHLTRGERSALATYASRIL
jgi:PhoH-like ATPase